MTPRTLRAALDLISVLGDTVERLEQENAHLKQQLHETTQALQKAAAALEEVQDRLDAQEAPQAVPTPDAPLCLSRHPDHSEVLCELEHGHDGDHSACVLRGGIVPGTLDWSVEGTSFQPTLGDLEAIEAHPWEGGVAPEADDAQATPQPEGEPPPSEWPAPEAPRAATTRRADPLHRFRGHLHRLCKAYAAARRPELTGDDLKFASNQIRYRLMRLWLNGAETTADDPKGKRPVDPRWYEGDLANDREIVGSLAWLSTVSDEQFKAAANAVLGVTRG